MAIGKTLLELKDEEINRLTKEQMLEIGKKALKMIRQQQRRLERAGYKISDSQRKFNEEYGKGSTVFSSKMDRKEVYHNLSLVKNQLENPLNNVQGRIAQQRKSMQFFKSYLNDGIAPDAKKREFFNFSRDRKTGDWKYSQAGKSGTLTKDDLDNFWTIFDELKSIFYVDMYKYKELVEHTIRVFMEHKDKMSPHGIIVKLQNELEEIYKKKWGK